MKYGLIILIIGVTNFCCLSQTDQNNSTEEQKALTQIIETKVLIKKKKIELAEKKILVAETNIKTKQTKINLLKTKIKFKKIEKINEGQRKIDSENLKQQLISVKNGLKKALEEAELANVYLKESKLELENTKAKLTLAQSGELNINEELEVELNEAEKDNKELKEGLIESKEKLLKYERERQNAEKEFLKIQEQLKNEN